MPIKTLFLAVFLVYVVSGLTLLHDKANAHLQSQDTQSITVKFRKDQIQDSNQCKKNDQQCEVKICPDSRVMKSSYTCYLVLKTQLDQWMKNKKSSSNLKIDLQCWKQQEQTYNPNVGAHPIGGFKNQLYSCYVA